MVMVNGSIYLVDLGPRYSLRFHIVRNDKTCSCGIAHCQAVWAVEAYLKGGGQRASEQALGSQLLPSRFPVYSAPINVAGVSWDCTRDRTHYWLYRTQRLRAARQYWIESLATGERTYRNEIWQTASDQGEHENFLIEHALKYPAGS